MQKYDDALAEISSCDPETDDAYTMLVALRVQCHSQLGNRGIVDRDLALLQSISSIGVAARFEAVYARWLDAWVLGDSRSMDRALEKLDGTRLSPWLQARLLYARSWSAGTRGEYAEQARLLEHAIQKMFHDPRALDVSLMVQAIRSLAHLTKEISAQASFDFLLSIIHRIAWTPDVAFDRFCIMCSLAWAHALRGEHEAAMLLMLQARDLATTPRSIVAIYADQAYLARMASDTMMSGFILNHAVQLARSIHWSTGDGERLALLNLAELHADADASAAQEMLDMYDSIAVNMAPTWAFAHDRRLAAIEKHARGCVDAVNGRVDEAFRNLSEAYAAFSALRYAWRAAASALRLYAVTGDHAWLERASSEVSDFPESSVAQQIRKSATGSSDPRVASLTPAQLRVFKLLCTGLSDRDVAAKLGIALDTAKNHAAKVRAAFGVQSRTALLVEARRAGLGEG